MLPDNNIGFHNLKVCSVGRGPMVGSMSQLTSGVMAYFDFNSDMTFLFPYLNSVATQSELYEIPSYIRFFFEDTLCVLYPKECFVSSFDDREHARCFVINLIAFLNDIKARKNEIIPNHKIFQQASITELLKILPQTNCRECGFSTCMAFAAMLSKQQTIPGRCPHIGYPLKEKAIYPVHDNHGNLLSTIIFDVDLKKNDDALQNTNEYIVKLEKKISDLSNADMDLNKSANESLPSPLTKREKQVLRLVACGVTNTEIAQIIIVSTHTVKSHVTHIFNKLGVNSRTQASVWAAQHNLI